eukprot:jgi/Galph1/1484/GphlegSOOS_G169.1
MYIVTRCYAFEFNCLLCGKRKSTEKQGFLKNTRRNQVMFFKKKELGDSWGLQVFCLQHVKLSRRAFVKRAIHFSSLLYGTAMISTSVPAVGEVFFDIDRYGDKELKISTINRLKQTLRNTLSNNLHLLPEYLQLAMHDALTFSKSTGKGGPNGSLRFELKRPGNSFLVSCFETIQGAYERYPDVGYADYLAYAGAVVMDIVGAPRVKLQVGREDAFEPDIENALARSEQGASYTFAVEESFREAGLSAEKNTVLFIGALGFLCDVSRKFGSSSNKATQGNEGTASDDIFENSEVTYGEISQKGKKTVAVGTQVRNLKLPAVKFSNQFLKMLYNSRKQQSKLEHLSDMYLVLLREPRFQEHVEFYANNNRKFTNDFVDEYEKMTLLGSRYETQKLKD